MVSDTVWFFRLRAGPGLQAEAAGSHVLSPGNWRPLHIYLPGWGQEEITKTFKQEARAGKQRGGLK